MFLNPLPSLGEYSASGDERVLEAVKRLSALSRRKVKPKPAARSVNQKLVLEDHAT